MKRNVLIRDRWFISLTESLILLTAATSAHAQFNCSTFSYPGTEQSYGLGIDGNDIVGSYFSYPFGIEASCAFILNGSSYTTLNVPGAVETTGVGVLPGACAEGVSGNNVVGYYYNGTSYQGFLYNGASYNTLSVPGAAATFANGISGNNIVGGYSSNPNGTRPSQGFLYNGVAYTTLNDPGAAHTGPGTDATSISGDNVVGYYYNGSTTEGFVYNINSGGYTTLSVPGSSVTAASGIDGNNIVGNYFTSSGHFEGFYYNGSSYATLIVPGAENTYPEGISGNEIVGYYETSSNVFDGFVATIVPEPSVIMSLLFGAIALLMGRKLTVSI